MSDPNRQSLSDELRAAIDPAHIPRDCEAARTLRLRVGESWFPIRAIDETGFDLDASFAPKLRGLVEIHEGATLLRTGLVVASEPSGDVVHYDFKRATEARRSPPRDYVTAEPWDLGATA
jgi:hypothetical protein